MVGFLAELSTRFDQLTAEAGFERIKTVGDEYMAVAGAPEPRADHAPAAIGLAHGMLGAVDEARRRVDAPLQLRIGLASGPVVGGVIGQQRILREWRPWARAVFHDYGSFTKALEQY